MRFKAQLIRAGHSERTTVFVTVEKRLLKLSTGEIYPIDSVSVGERAGINSPFFIHLPTGDQLIIVENVKEFNEEFYKHLPIHKKDWLHRFETWGKSLIISVVVLIAATVFWVTKGSDLVAEWITNRISYDLEYELGRHVISGLQTIGWTIRKPISYDEKKVEKMLYQLAEESDVPNTEFYIFDNVSMINAFAIPGGFIVFTSKIVEDYISEENGLEALAGVAAHELGHIKHRHSLKILIKSALIASIFTLLTGDASVVSLGMAQQLISLAYNRKQEVQADTYAIKLLIKSNIEPDPFIRWMEHIADKYSTDEVPEFLQSHPHMSERIKNMRNLIDQIDEGDIIL